MRYSCPPAAAGTGSARSAFWVDLFEPTADEVAEVEREYGLRLPVRSQLDEIENSSRLRVEGQTLYLSMPATAPFKEPDSAPSPIGFVLSPEVLVTHEFPLAGYREAVRAALDKSASRAMKVVFRPNG